MSSSKIIKAGCVNGVHIMNYSFDSVHEVTAGKVAEHPMEFVPFLNLLNADAGSCREATATAQAHHEQPEEVAPAAVEECTGVSEEELYRQVQEAYDRGFEEGKKQAERGLANVFKALREAMEELTGLHDKVLRESEEDLLELAIMVARKVIHQEIATDRLILAKVVSAAISSASERDEIVIRLNPEDHRIVTAHKNLYLSGCSDDRLLELKADDSVSQGGCIVETTMGEIDAQTDTQLDEIFRRLIEERNSTVILPPRLAGEKEHYAFEEN